MSALIDKKLTTKQQKFADYYLQTGNATEAAIKAGYSKKTAAVIGAENLTKPNIKNYIDERLEEMASERIADATEVMEYLTSVMRRQYEENVVVTVTSEETQWVDGKKQTMKKESPVVVKIPSRLTDANKAAELLGKRYRLFTDKVELEGNVGVTIVDDVDE